MTKLEMLEAALGASGWDPTKIAQWVIKYGPAIDALIQVIELHQDEKKRAQTMDGITRGLQFASQTGDTSLLEAAVASHCTSALGCRVQ